MSMLKVLIVFCYKSNSLKEENVEQRIICTSNYEDKLKLRLTLSSVLLAYFFSAVVFFGSIVMETPFPLAMSFTLS